MSLTLAAVAGEVVFKELIKYAVPKSWDLTKKGLDLFVTTIQGDSQLTTLPSAALMGFGRCGTSICVEVARQLEAVIPAAAAGAAPPTVPTLRKIWDRMAGDGRVRINPYLFEPVILLADVDAKMGQADKLAPSDSIVPGYARCSRIDLDRFYRHGCGNIPQVGQYLARVMTSTPLPESEFVNSTKAPKFTSWELSRSYLLDSVGAAENPTRLMIYVFSTGGGTGSGLSSEIGTAQQYMLLRRIREAHQSQGKAHLESYVSLGVGVMPSMAEQGIDANLLNTGRMLVSYLSRLERFRTLSSRAGEVTELDVPAFDSLILVSNNITEPLVRDPTVPLTAASKAANVYISQHLFNLLLAQSLPSDLSAAQVVDESRRQLIEALRDGGLEGGELGSLDPSDLKNSLYGPTVACYAETRQTADLDLKRLLQAAISNASYNKDTESIDGISVAPLPFAEYAPYFGVDFDESIEKLGGELPLFRQAISVVVVLSVPTARAGVLKANHVRILKDAISRLFVKASVRRYVVIPDSGELVTLGVFISGSGHFTYEGLRAISAYGLNCLSGASRDGQFEELLDDAFGGVDGSEHALGEALLSTEELGPILASYRESGPFLSKRMEVEALSRAHSGVQREFGSVLIQKEDFLAAMRLIRAGLALSALKEPERSVHLVRASGERFPSTKVQELASP